MRPSLLVIVAKVTIKATLHATGVAGLWSVFEEMPELFKEVWMQWTGEVTTPEARGRDLEATTQAGDDTIDQAVDDPSVREVLDQVPPEKRPDVARDARAVLKQIRANARHTFRRPDDPTGLTVPPALAPREARDLIPILMARKPRFARGDRPIAGMDWELEELLGIGGFGEVWKARHLHLSNEPRRALKFCIDPEAQVRLRTVEAVICDRVRRRGHHSGIVRLIDTNLSADPPCLHFEYVPGGDLAGLVRQWKGRGRYPSHDLIAKAMLQIAKPVAFAHTLDEQIVHRDLKPSNILVARSPDGKKILFKITDFGIGGMVNPNSAARSRAGSLRSLAYLQAISGSGTPLYASPEQMKGEPVSPTDDVHALGVIWYQLLIGDLTEGRPGGDGWKDDLAEKGMPEPLIRLLGSCFEKAKRRPPNAQEFVEVLERHLAESSDRESNPVGSAIADQTQNISTPPKNSDVENRSAIADPTHREPPAAEDATSDLPEEHAGSGGWGIAVTAFVVVLVLLAFWIRRPEQAEATPGSIASNPPVVTPGSTPPNPLRATQTPLMASPDDPRTESAPIPDPPLPEPEKLVETRAVPNAAPPDPPKAAPPASPPPPDSNPQIAERAARNASNPTTPTDKPAATTSSYTNSLGMTMIGIEPGEFDMGSSKDQIDKLLKLYPKLEREWFDDEQPQHKVRITRPFHLASHEVTVGQFRRFVEATGYQTEAERAKETSTWRNPGFKQEDNHPVVCVSHNDALAFIDWLNEQESRDGRGYRLPTEAEWEYACRAGTGGGYGGTDDPETLVRLANVADASLKKAFPNAVLTLKGDDGFEYTSPVGSFEPNAWGLYDMIGNVLEWCDDWYDPKYYQSSPAEDPRNLTKAAYRVSRGGGWNARPRNCRPALRGWYSPGYRDYFLGFRLAAVR
ncbi:MAG: bifunctional serine/threonine-protein kinase/formylglycine-generating enzyme family protein [Isosphaeraceae bacterium]